MRLQKLLYNSVLPTVRELTDSPDHLVIILPTLLALITNSTDDEYRTLLLPELRKVLAMTRPIQVHSLLFHPFPFPHLFFLSPPFSLLLPVLSPTLPLSSSLPLEVGPSTLYRAKVSTGYTWPSRSNQHF